MKRLTMLALASAAAGCATGPTISSEARPIEASSSFATPFSNSGTITVVRDSGYICFGAGTRVFIDGVEAGKLGTGEKLVAYVQPGNHIIGVTTTFCAGGTSQTAVVTQQGTNSTLRTGFRQSGDILIEPSAF
jgi:hypothetical protein